jgi:glutamyl-tRNA synthetase
MDRGVSIAQRMGLATSADTFNPVIVDFYEQVGFLPDAILNYLLLLGWSLDDKREDFTREQIVEYFSLDRVNKAPASFDPQKLFAFQDRAMQQLPPKQKVARCLPYLQRAGLVTDPPPCDTGPYLSHILAAAGDRVKVAGDVLDYADFYTPDEQLAYDAQAFDKRIARPERARELLTAIAAELPAVEPFDTPTLEAFVHRFVETRGLKIGDVIHALRVAVTGKAVGFGLFDALAILGAERSVRRINKAVAKAR